MTENLDTQTPLTHLFTSLFTPRTLIRLLFLSAFGCLAGWHQSAAAQAVAAVSDEARTLPGGDFRLSIAESDTRFNQVYGPSGLQPLGAALSFDSLSPTQLPVLNASQNAIQSLTGNNSYRLTLGNLIVNSALRTSSTPVIFELGLTHWLTLRANVPVVRTHNEIFVNPNSKQTANAGINPALIAGSIARATDSAFVAQFRTAGSSLQADLAACQANPSSAGYCPTLNAQASAITALVQQSQSFATAMGNVYGGNGATPALVVPTVNSGAQQVVNAKVAKFDTSYAHFDSLTGGPGISGPGPVAATPIGTNDIQTIFTSSAFGVGIDSLQSRDRVSVGDIDLSATLQLFDSFHGSDSARMHPHGFNARTAITGGYRLGTGQVSSPGTLVETGDPTGTGANAIEVSSATDLLFGSHFWSSFIVRSSTPLSDHIVQRIPTGPGDVFTPAFTQQLIGRTLGRSMQYEIDPHYTFNDYFDVNATYLYLQKQSDRYVGRFSLDSAQTGIGAMVLDASILDQGTNWTEQRIGLGLTYSTVAAASRGHVIPFEISYIHTQTSTGSGTGLPRMNMDAVQIRVYMRLWSRRASGA